MLSSDIPALVSEPASIKMTESGSQLRKKFKKPAQKQQKFQFRKQQSHPALQYKDNSFDFLDLGRDVLMNVAQHVGESSQDRMMRLALSSIELQDIVKNNPRYWRNAAVTEFNSTARLSGISSFKLYNFLCQFKWWEGKFFIRRHTHRDIHLFTKNRRRPCRPTPVEMLEIEFTDTGLLMSIWRSPGLARELLPPQKKGHFLEVKFDSFDDNEHLDLVSDKFVTRLQGTGDWSQNVSTLNGCSVESFLSERGCLLHKLIFMMEIGEIIPLRMVTANGLDSKYLRSDGSWPQALPKPGVYVTDDGLHGFVGYSSEVFRLTLPETRPPEEYRHIDVKVASAFVMPLEEQIHLDYDDYMAYEEGLHGNPNQLNDLHVVHLPPTIGHADDLRARAWYSPCPPTHWQEGRWKVAVLHEDELIIIDDVDFNVWRLRRRPDIT